MFVYALKGKLPAGLCLIIIGTEGYPKAALLETALRACAEVDESEFAADLSAAEAVDAAQTARAAAIAQAFRSQRWSDEVT
jgi:tRNA nucleotidyltransferase (CCA-adding enzyme)